MLQSSQQSVSCGLRLQLQGGEQWAVEFGLSGAGFNKQPQFLQCCGGGFKGRSLIKDLYCCSSITLLQPDQDQGSQTAGVGGIANQRLLQLLDRRFFGDNQFSSEQPHGQFFRGEWSQSFKATEGCTEFDWTHLDSIQRCQITQRRRPCRVEFGCFQKQAFGCRKLVLLLSDHSLQVANFSLQRIRSSGDSLKQGGRIFQPTVLLQRRGGVQ
jgi:hypothetical protein